MKTILLTLSLLFAAQQAKATTFLRPGPEQHEARMAKELGLDAKQEKAIKSIKEKNREATKGDRDEMKKLHNELDLLLDNPKTESKVIKAKHAQIQALRNKTMEIRFSEMLEIREILTPAQIQKFKDARHKMRKYRSERRMPFHD